MSDNKTYILENILNTLSVKDLKSIIQENNALITDTIENLAILFRKPRSFVTTDYAESNRLVNSIIKIKEKEPVKYWLEELAEVDKTYLNKENHKLYESSCDYMIHQAKEIKEKFQNDYSDIIKEIQYHDITRQKLEHVVEINNDIFNELLTLESNSNGNSELKHLKALKEIFSIEIAQLKYSYELCKSAIEHINNAFEDQSTYIDKSKNISQKLKQRILEILNIIDTDEELSDIINDNTDRFRHLSKLTQNNIEKEIYKHFPNGAEFDKVRKLYDTHIIEIKALTLSKSNFFEVIQLVINNLKDSQEKLFKDHQEILESNLDFIKQKYTMNSEYKIHELALEDNLLKDYFSEMNNSEEDNDVEFF